MALRNTMDSTTRKFLLIVVAIILIVCSPLAIIWSLNTLFKIGIGYTIKTWAAAFVLTLLLSGSVSRSRKG